MQPTSKQSKQKKMLVAVAIFVLPVIAIAFIAFNLLHKHKKVAPAARGSSAFNATLPSANLPKEDKNKFQLYMQAQQDSMKWKEEKAKDPYTNQNPAQSSVPFDPKAPFQTAGAHSAPDNRVPAYEDPNEKKVNDHLQRLYAALDANGGADGQNRYAIPAMPPVPDLGAAQREKLERLMTLLQKKDTAPDLQLQQVNQVLDKIIQIKNPPAKNASSAGPTETNPALPVSTRPVLTDGNSLQGDPPDGPNGFFGLSDDADSIAVATSAIQAVIHTTQTVQTGSIVKLRLLQDIFVGVSRIPANTFIYGRCSIDGERVDIQLTNAIAEGNIYPIKMRVFDGVDGLEGLYVPGAITRDVIKEGMSQGVSGVSIPALDPSLGAQAAAAGIETVKNLLSRKIRIVKVTLKAGHVAILKNPEGGR